MALFENAQSTTATASYPVEQMGVRKIADRNHAGLSTPRDRAGARGRGAGARRGALAASDIDLLITTSCTGHHDPVGGRATWSTRSASAATCGGCRSPSSAAWAARRRWRARTTSCAASRRRASLVIAVELPSLCLQRDDISPANLVASALFGDGAAAAVLDGAAAATGAGVRVLETLSHIFPSSTGALGFDLRRGRLSLGDLEGHPGAAEERRSSRWSNGWPRARGLTRDQLTCFVLHPGGKKILGAVEDELGLAARGDPAVVGRAARLRQPVERVGAVRAARVADASGSRRLAATACSRRSGPG